jgi:cation/acetate symporter
MKGDFLSNLGRIYGFYTGGFLGFVILLAILEQLGVPNKIIGYLFVFFTLAVYAGIGILSRTMQVSEYYVAGRRVPPLYNGMATAADWMSAASFIAMAGGLYARGYDGLAFVLGWTGGYVLVAVLIAPYLRKFGAYTVPDFLGSRFGGNFARTIGIIVLFCCSFTYIVGQVVGVGTIASRFLGISFEIAVFVGLIGILVCSMMGGMRAVTWTQVAQYIVLIIVYRADHRLHGAGGHPVSTDDRHPGPAADVWRHPAAHHRAGADERGAGRCNAACHSILVIRSAQLLCADPVSDGWHRLASARADAVLHHAQRA